MSIWKKRRLSTISLAIFQLDASHGFIMYMYMINEKLFIRSLLIASTWIQRQSHHTTFILSEFGKKFKFLFHTTLSDICTDKCRTSPSSTGITFPLGLFTSTVNLSTLSFVGRFKSVIGASSGTVTRITSTGLSDVRGFSSDGL